MVLRTLGWLTLGLLRLVAASHGAHSEAATQYEYIVVGSGAGGGTLASRLAREGHSTLLIEAGDDQSSNDNTTIPLFQYATAKTAQIPSPMLTFLQIPCHGRSRSMIMRGWLGDSGLTGCTDTMGLFRQPLPRSVSRGTRSKVHEGQRMSLPSCANRWWMRHAQRIDLHQGTRF